MSGFVKKFKINSRFTKGSRTVALALLCIPLSGLLTACSSGVVNKMAATTKAAFTAPEDTVLTEQQLHDLSYAAQYLRIKELPQSMVVLAYTNAKAGSQGLPQQFQQWQTTAGESLLFRNGRLVGTRGLAQEFSPFSADLISVNPASNQLQPDPLRCALVNSSSTVLSNTPANAATECNGQWQAQIHWGEGQAQQTFYLHSEISYQGRQSVQLGNGNRVDAAHYQEQARVISDSGEHYHYVNHYWYAHQQLVKSTQQLVPGLPQVSTVAINRQQEPLATVEGSNSNVVAALEQQLLNTSDSADNQLIYNDTTYQLGAGARLSQVIADIVTVPQAVDWQHARLSSEHLQLRVDTLKEEVLLDLAQRYEVAVANGDRAMQNSTQWLYQYIDRTEFTASYYLGIPYYRLRTDPAIDPVLAEPRTAHNGSWFNPSGQSQFRLYAPMLKAGNVHNAPKEVTEHMSLSDYAQQLRQHLAQRFRDGGHAFNTEQLYRISANGDTALIPVAAYNQRQAATCWEHRVSAPTRSLQSAKQDTAKDCWPHRVVQNSDRIVVGLHHEDALNRRIALLAKFAERFNPLTAPVQPEEAGDAQ